MKEKNEMQKKKMYIIPQAQEVRFGAASVVVTSGGHEEHETWDNQSGGN